MRKLKTKLAFTIMFFVMLMLVITGVTYAASTNENVQIVLTPVGSRDLIYIRGHLDSDFRFAFSNNPNNATDAMPFRMAGLDADENSVAYIDNAMRGVVNFNDPVYLFIRVGTDNATQIPISLTPGNSVASVTDLETASRITRRIPVVPNIGEIDLIRETIGEKDLIVTVGMLEIVDRVGQYEYQIVRIDRSNADHVRLMTLADRIERFDVDTASDVFTRMQTYSEFIGLYNAIATAEISPQGWNEALGNNILQSEESQEGDRYIVFIRASAEDVLPDAQFLTATRYEDERTRTDMVSGLPVTGESFVLIITLGVLLGAILVVVIVLKREVNNER